MDGNGDGTIIVDNQYLKHLGKDIKSAYDGINTTIAMRFLFLLKALDSEMMMVTDLGISRLSCQADQSLPQWVLGKATRICQ